MSREIGGSIDALAIIKEEQASPVNSSNVINTDKTEDAPPPDIENMCPCKDRLSAKEEARRAAVIEKMLKQREETLTAEFHIRIEKEIKMMKDRFDYILQNEQIRASHMMREAHRERKEKIAALQTQLECKNLAGLMFVMCSERRKSKLQILRLVEDYTTYIKGLQHILAESQALILKLSCGYKTAARVDQEWKDKMDRVINEFLGFIYHFSGGTPDTNQYFIDIPALMQTKAPIEDDPTEDPCDVDEVGEEKYPIPKEKNWWELIEGDDPPFIVFGDMAEFKPPERREVLKTVKAAKSAPKKWKEYGKSKIFEYILPVVHLKRDTFFHENIVSANCPNLDSIKDEYLKYQPTKSRWECQNMQTERPSSRGSETSQRRVTTASVDLRGTMGSILKIMEPCKLDDEEFADESLSALGSLHNDSMDVIPTHVPDHDHKIHYEKTCPMEQCQRMKMDSFIRTLPPYMQASPFTHYEQTYDEYELCSPEQLEILKQRIEDKKRKEKVDFHLPDESPLSEWPQNEDGVAVQTSDMSLSLPPCTCGVEKLSSASSVERVFKVADLIPIKEKLDQINDECFYQDNIDFNRFGVVGQENEIKLPAEQDFAKERMQHITKILRRNPSLCEIFQANIR
ncbi:unnamed protein product [Leptosia nina]|uniref:Uncharacterized protein n=1 Tax=Leptosia nina TaxID=320188 RepID=A0AAV1IVK0_9NEOP